LLVLWCGQSIEETTAHILACLATSIKLRYVILSGLGLIVSTHILDVGLVDYVGLERLRSSALGSIVTNKHNLNILLMWVWIALAMARIISVWVSTDLYLLNASMTIGLR